MRILILALAALAAWAAAATAQPAPWQPAHPIRLIVAYAPGSGPDIVGRLLAQQLSGLLGQSVVVENRPGAGGNLGTEAVVRAAPDGSTLGAIPAAPLAINPHLIRPPFDPVRDLTPIAEFAGFVSAVAVSASVPVHSLAELPVWLRSERGKVSCSGATVGSMPHVGLAALLHLWGVECPQVHYANASVLPDLIAGRTVVALDNLAILRGPAQTDQVRLLAVSSPARLPGWPALPAVAETIPGFEAVSWMGLLGPARLPAPVLARLEQATMAAAAAPETAARLAEIGALPLRGDGAALARRISSESARWGQVIRENNIKIE